MEKWFPIETQRLLLREFTEADEADVHEYGSDPVVTRYEKWGPNTPGETRTVVAEWVSEQHVWPRNSVTLAVELKAERKLIGGFRLAIVDPLNRTADFGYCFNRRYWNNGYATEATRAVLQRAFTVLNLHRVWATCDVRNTGSWRVMEKAGMRREAHFRRDSLQKGEWRDSYVYAILEDDYKA